MPDAGRICAGAERSGAERIYPLGKLPACSSDLVGRLFFHSRMGLVGATMRLLSSAKRFEYPERVCLTYIGSCLASSIPRISLVYVIRWECLLCSLADGFMLAFHVFVMLDDVFVGWDFC